MKKIITGFAVLALGLALSASPASAHSQGPVALAVDLTNVNVSNFNFGSIDNDVDTSANTGLNETEKGGSSDTGDADASSSVGNGLNSSTTTVGVSDFQEGPIAVNADVKLEEDSVDSAESHDGDSKTAIALDITKVNVSNFNFGMVENEVDTSANTGYNETERGGDSNTGDAMATAGVSTSLNSNNTSVTVEEGGLGPIAVNANVEYEADSAGHHNGSFALAVDYTAVSVENVNVGGVQNDVYTGANTGYNETEHSGSSDTGDASATSNVTNSVNSNTTTVGVTDGGFGPVAANVSVSTDNYIGGSDLSSVGPVAANVNTDGTSVSADVTTASVDNANIAEVSNNVDTAANTGGNETEGSHQQTEETVTGGGTSSDTGNASATSTVSNTVNTNSTTVVISK